MILAPAMHYVDDYGSMEDSPSANSSFESFEKYSGCLQIAMKPKRQPPDTAHRTPGVIISSDEDNLILTPCPKRVTSMCQQIDKHLESGTISPEQARKMAGKCNFLTGRLFGKVGRAPLKALYARANSSTHNIDKPTRSSPLALRDIILHCKPMTIPRAPAKTTYSVIYTDAYFKLGSTTYKPGDPDIPNWDSGKTAEIENGWAAVCFHHGDVQRAAYFQGRLRSVLARQFSSDRRFSHL